MAYNITVEPNYFYIENGTESTATNAPISVSTSPDSDLLQVNWDSGSVKIDPTAIDDINAVALSPKTLANAFTVINTAITP